MVFQSIHPFSLPAYCYLGSQRSARADRTLMANAGVHPGQVAGPSQGHVQTIHTHTLTHSLTDKPDICFSGKPAQTKKTHARPGRTFRLHTANHQATMLHKDNKKDGACRFGMCWIVFQSSFCPLMLKEIFNKIALCGRDFFFFLMNK